LATKILIPALVVTFPNIVLPFSALQSVKNLN